jgi:hypothetical protein
MQPTCPKCGKHDLRIIQSAELGMFVFCNTVGCFTFPVQTNFDQRAIDAMRKYRPEFRAMESLARLENEKHEGNNLAPCWP